MTILNKMIPNRKVKIRLIRDDFSSPVLGNVWIGREVTLNIATANRFVELGYAEFADAEKATPQKGKSKDDSESGGEGEGAAGGEGEPMTLEAAIKALNPEDDAHWTQGGQPDLNVLKELTGKAVKRKEVEEIAPDFSREVAAESAKKE